MKRCVLLVVLCHLALTQGSLALAEDYSECRVRCETENTDCVNEPPAPDPEVQSAKLESCERKLRICYAECEYLKPVEPPDTTESNPNIIHK